jgi:uncharacterized membrane protein YidH (DUF202 family)
MRYVFLGIAFLSMGIGLLIITNIIFGIILIIFSVIIISIGIVEYFKHEKRRDSLHPLPTKKK